MKLRLLLTLWGCVFFVAVSAAAGASTFAQDKPKDAAAAQTKLTDDEAKQIEKMNKAATLADKVKFGTEFVKKYKKNTEYRAKIASYLAGQLFNEKDLNQKIQGINQFKAAFDQPSEIDQVQPALIDAYINGGKFDEAFAEGAKYIAAHPEDVFVAQALGFNGVLQIQKQGANWKHAKATNEYLTKALEILEQDKKPEKTEKAVWESYRNSWLPKLYQAQGVMFIAANEKVKGKEQLEKAFGFDPYDLVTLNSLVQATYDEYQVVAQKYQTERKQALMDQAIAKMDELIDYLARATAAADSNPQFAQAGAQFKDQLKQYYEFRYPGKAADMQALIDKYKKK